MKLAILLLDDLPGSLNGLREQLESIAGFDLVPTERPWHIMLGDENVEVTCDLVFDPDEALKIMQDPSPDSKFRTYDLVLVDNDWEEAQRHGWFGMQLLTSAKCVTPSGPLIAIYTGADYSGENQSSFVSQAIGAGAAAFISKTEGSVHLLNVLLFALERKRVRETLAKASKLGGLIAQADPAFATKSPIMTQALEDAAFAAPWANEPVLVLGEVGTGKTRLARAIHDASPRAAHPFVEIDIGQLDESSAKNELFGVTAEGGAGLLARNGILEIADRGTVLIDEVQGIPKWAQDVLRNVIERKRFRKVGSPAEQDCNVRFIFASSEKVAALTEAGRLGSEFAGRISGQVIELPPLRQRLEDLPALADFFMREFYAEYMPAANVPCFTDDAIEKLSAEPWQHNLRGLRNTIRRTAVRLGDKREIDDVDLELHGENPFARGDIRQVLQVAPRGGSQRSVFNMLLERVPSGATYAELSAAMGEPGVAGSTAPAQLMTVISRLRQRLNKRGFDVVHEEGKGYVMVRVA